jgi:hypothetical protein
VVTRHCRQPDASFVSVVSGRLFSPTGLRLGHRFSSSFGWFGGRVRGPSWLSRLGGLARRTISNHRLDHGVRRLVQMSSRF